MKKAFITTILMVLLLALLSACGEAEIPAPTAPAAVTAEQATSEVAEAPLEPTAPAAEPQTEAPATPTINGSELLESRCITCHSLEKTTSRTGTLEEWDNIVTRMIAKGADLTDEEKSILVQYLAETYK